MAYADTHLSIPGLRHSLARPFVALGNMLDMVAQASVKAEAAGRILDMSDESLAEKGLTRDEAIRKLFND